MLFKRKYVGGLLNMNLYFLSASVLGLLVELFHTVLKWGPGIPQDEVGFIPTDGGCVRRESNVRILWASWHVLTVFGWGMALILLWPSRQSSFGATFTVVENIVAASMLGGRLWFWSVRRWSILGRSVYWASPYSYGSVVLPSCVHSLTKLLLRVTVYCVNLPVSVEKAAGC